MSGIEKLITEQIESGKLQVRKLENGELEIVNTQTDHLPPVANTYKDRIFRMVFKDKKDFLMLYNAMHDTDYTDTDNLSVSTLENAIYMSMKNDVSFVLYDKLVLYEHQSTKNPNMPLRNLFYVADIYSELTRDKNIYGTKLLKIPEPRFAVFYNGTDKIPEKSTLRLSDMYENTSGQTALELITEVYNINLGYNNELMEKCKTLYDYAIFVDTVRRYRKRMPLKAAIAEAIDECISNGVLADFLKSNKAEVLKMGLYEYDEELHIRLEREDAHEEGRLEGRLEGLEEGRLKERQTSIINLIKMSQELNISLENTMQKLKEMYSLSENEVKSYVTQYWKN